MLSLTVHVTMEGYAEGRLDKMIEERLIYAVTEELKKSVLGASIKAIQNRLLTQIDGWILDTLASFVDRPITITDRWGEIQATYANITDMLKEKLDAFLSEPVDERGETLRQKNCAVKGNTRLDFLANSKIESLVRKYATEVMADADKKIKDAISEADRKMKAELSEKLINKIMK